MNLNQVLIDQEVQSLREKCSANGDEYTKQQLEKFGSDWKKVVTENAKA